MKKTIGHDDGEPAQDAGTSSSTSQLSVRPEVAEQTPSMSCGKFSGLDVRAADPGGAARARSGRRTRGFMSWAGDFMYRRRRRVEDRGGRGVCLARSVCLLFVLDATVETPSAHRCLRGGGASARERHERSHEIHEMSASRIGLIVTCRVIDARSIQK